MNRRGARVASTSVMLSFTAMSGIAIYASRVRGSSAAVTRSAISTQTSTASV